MIWRVSKNIDTTNTVSTIMISTFLQYEFSDLLVKFVLVELLKSVHLKKTVSRSSGAPRLARPPRPGPCLDFRFQYALIRNNRSKKFGVEYWVLPGSNSPWHPWSSFLSKLWYLLLFWKVPQFWKKWGLCNWVLWTDFKW